MLQNLKKNVSRCAFWLDVAYYWLKRKGGGFYLTDKICKSWQKLPNSWASLKPFKISRFVYLMVGNSRQDKTSSLEILQNFLPPWEFQDQKSKSLDDWKIPHDLGRLVKIETFWKIFNSYIILKTLMTGFQNEFIFWIWPSVSRDIWILVLQKRVFF